MAAWSQLPGDILGQILEKLPLADYIRVGGVCASWNSIVKAREHRHKAQPPWLMIFDDGDEQSCARFFSLSEKRTYRLRLPEPPIRRRLCIGSSFGWLITVSEACEVHLLNPISGIQILLPSIDTLPFLDAVRDSEGRITGFLETDDSVLFEYKKAVNEEPELRSLEHMFCCFFEKAVLSSRPSADGSGDFIVMLIHGPDARMAFTKAGEKAWTSLRSPHDFKDIIVRDGSFFTICSWGRVHAWDWDITRNDSGFTDARHHSAPRGSDGWSFRPRLVSTSKENSLYVSYLINSIHDGQLLMLHRERWRGELGEEIRKTTDMKLLRMNNKTLRWHYMKDMKDIVLFIGSNQSISFSATEYPELKRNSIYFTDDVIEYSSWERHWTRDIGVFDMTEKRVNAIDSLPTHSTWPPPIWMTPTLF